MKSRVFNVPTELMTNFATAISEYELENEVRGVSDDDDVCLEIYYELELRKLMHKLQDLIDDYNEQEDEDDKDDEDDGDEDDEDEDED